MKIFFYYKTLCVYRRVFGCVIKSTAKHDAKLLCVIWSVHMFSLKKFQLNWMFQKIIYVIIVNINVNVNVKIILW